MWCLRCQDQTSAQFGALRRKYAILDIRLQPHNWGSLLLTGDGSRFNSSLIIVVIIMASQKPKVVLFDIGGVVVCPSFSHVFLRPFFPQSIS